MVFEKASEEDVKEVGALYDSICDYLEKGTNYPCWEKGVYPNEDTARSAQNEGTLYVCRKDGLIVGTIILRHEPETGFEGVAWQVEDDYAHIIVGRTLAVRGDCLGLGVGAFIMKAMEDVARAEGCTAIRFDVVTGNIPAENLYKKYGYKFIETKSMGLEEIGISWFNLYEKLL